MCYSWRFAFRSKVGIWWRQELKGHTREVKSSACALRCRSVGLGLGLGPNSLFVARLNLSEAQLAATSHPSLVHNEPGFGRVLGEARATNIRMQIQIAVF